MFVVVMIVFTLKYVLLLLLLCLDVSSRSFGTCLACFAFLSHNTHSRRASVCAFNAARQELPFAKELGLIDDDVLDDPLLPEDTGKVEVPIRRPVQEMLRAAHSVCPQVALLQMRRRRRMLPLRDFDFFGVWLGCFTPWLGCSEC